MTGQSYSEERWCFRPEFSFSVLPVYGGTYAVLEYRKGVIQNYRGKSFQTIEEATKFAEKLADECDGEVI